jgi:hypothetical protein
MFLLDHIKKQQQRKTRKKKPQIAWHRQQK